MARPIFRETALRRHNERLEKVELPRYATLPWAWLWLAGGLLLALCAGLLWAADVPVYATGAGFVAQMEQDEATIVALFPAETAPQLAAGQAARVDLPGVAGRPAGVSGAVVAVEPHLLSPAAAQARFPLLATAPDGPVAVVHLTLDAAALPTTDGTGGDLWRGSRAEARVAIDTQSGMALLPGLGRLWTEGR